ncbi:MAG: NUDIX domain-containing protein [Spongiibacteraceae bacterium]
MNFCPQCAQPLAKTAIDGEIRNACSDNSCGFVHFNNPTPVIAMIVEVAGGVVMAHNVSWPRKFYSIITGFLEEGEDPLECAIRETKEELNLDTIDSSLVGAYAFPQQNQVIIAYHIKAAGEIKLNEELDDYRITPAKQIRPWDFGTGLALKDWLATQPNG